MISEAPAVPKILGDYFTPVGTTLKQSRKFRPMLLGLVAIGLVAKGPSFPVVAHANPYTIEAHGFADQENNDQDAKQHDVPVEHI